MYSDASVADKFSKTTGSGGNGKLTYPVGLITADEIAFAGGKAGTNSPNTYYYLNSVGGSVTGSNWWWTMSPYRANSSSNASVFGVGGSSNPGYLSYYVVNYSYAVRPVVSLKSNVLVSGGNGTASNPYIVEAG